MVLEGWILSKEQVLMSAREVDRLGVVRKVLAKRLLLREAAVQLF